MKKLSFILVFLTSFCFLAIGQKYKVSLSPEFKLPKNKVLQDHLHSNDTGHYLYFKEGRGKKEKVVLEKYDRKFKVKFSKSFSSGKDNMYSYGLRYFKGQFAWMAYEKNKKDDYLQFYVTPIDMKGKGGKSKPVAKFKYEKKKDFPTVFWKVSSDTSKILFVAEIDKNDKKKNVEAYVSVLDHDFNKVWEKKVKLPFTEKKGHTYSWVVNNEGDVFFMAKIYDDNSKKESKKKGRGRKRKPAYQMKIYNIGQSGVVEDYKLKLNDAFVRGSGLRTDNENNLACVGFFSDSKSGPLQGVFYLKIDAKTGETMFSNKRRFTAKELDSFGDKNTSKDKKSKDSGLDDEFKFRRIIIKDDGGVQAIAEENYIYTSTTTSSNGATSTRTYYVSNSIVVIDIDPKGEVKKVGIIPKRQTFGTPIYGKHAILNTGDQSYFVYNDDKDNLRKNITDPDKIRRISSARDCVAVVTSLDESGKMKRKEMFSKKESKSLLMPSSSSQINEKELFFFNLRAKLMKNNFRFGVLEIQ